MSIHYTLFWLFLTAAFGKSDLGLPGVVAATVGLAALAIAIVGMVRKPSWRLLWLLLPIGVVHIFLQVVGIWLIGDHHEALTLSIYWIALLGTASVGAFAARSNRIAAAGTTVFTLVYGWIAFSALLFVFWNGFH